MDILKRLLAGTAIVGATMAATMPHAIAQTSQGEDATHGGSSEDIVVTGSRIIRTGADNPTPTTVLNAETIRQSGVTEIADLVNQLPSLFVTQTNQTSNQSGNAGVNALDLRGLGTERTLVLVNGRRRVASMPGSSAVDISTLPTNLVERVDVITGGASALYGADAVAGVANFILKKDFEGLEANARYGVSTRGDLGSYDLDLIYGQNFAGGRGNFTLFGAYSNSPDQVRGQDRPWTANGTPLYARQADGTFKLTDGNRSIYDHAEAIVELGGRGNLYTFTPQGALRRPQLGPGGILNLNSPGTISDLSSYLTDGGEFLGRYDDWLLQVPSERWSTFGTFNYEFSDRISFFADAGYSRTHSRAGYQAHAAYGYDYVPADSPFITSEMIAANGGPILYDIPFTRRYSELGRGEALYRRSTVQATAGLEGTIPNLFGYEWKWTASYSFGQTRQEVESRNGTATDRYYLALDTTSDGMGNAICRSTLTDPTNGCVPLNPFQQLTPQVIDYLQYDTNPSRQTLRQHVLSGYLTGSLFALPAGEVQVVLGGEYRSESNNIGATPEFDPTSPLFDPTIGVTETALVGKYDVTEIFGELRVPLLKEKPFFHSLAIEGAVRYSDYSTAGGTTAYKLAGEWAPVRDIRFRTTYGKAVRAPNISELFTSTRVGGEWLADPCNYWDVVNRSTRTQYTAANCAIISPQNVNTYWQFRDVISTGNTDLGVETAKTLTAGAVVKPRFLPNLTVSVDYFDIKLRGAIDSFGAQQILNKCVDAPTLDNIFCDFVTRDANNDLVSVVTKQLNLSEYRTKGVDIEADIWFDLGRNAGRLSFNAAFTRLISRKFTYDPTDANTINETAGVFGAPKWKGVVRTNYANGPFTLNWNMRYLSSMRPSESITSDLYDVVHTGDVFYHDFYGSVDVNQKFTLFAGVNNAFDRAPPRLPGAESGGANFEYGATSGLYDVIGRTVYVGVRLRR
ncbi:TonB-dependent receptor domain-containing protein [Sphingomonas sp. C3-2]|uniref:TonB-dependent receptor domain-containing protein n=1 Tax=Sphingomonas sp. C3-2 TaxID=3062169 RepID=UPI00294B5EF1|nr:TonB-dependent receptor [Sphingomonas sp. C3-2]WOK37531.1 TonB-dependent receptor [Sphingomonas sp. C3-2]